MADKEIVPSVQESYENNEWFGIRGFEIPLNIEPPITLLQGLLEVINNLLDFSLFILDFVKAFVRNFLNPTLSLVKKIISFLKKILLDIRQYGVYFTSDSVNDTDALLGGYPAFERRMLARLTNEDDPNRPNFTNQTAVMGLYLYFDTAVGDINISQIIKAYNTMMKMFKGLGQTKTPRVPAITNFSAENVRIREQWFSDELGEQALEMKWQVAGSNGTVFNNPVGGFLIEVSTELEGFYLAYDGVVLNATHATDKGGKRRRGLVRDKNTKGNVRIFGGETWIQDLDEVFYEEGTQKDFEIKLVRNPNSNKTVSPSEFLDNKPSKTFFVPIFDFSMDNSKEYSIKIKYTDLPEGYDLITESDFPREKVAVRIRTINTTSRDAIIKQMGDDIEISHVGEPRYYSQHLKFSYQMETLTVGAKDPEATLMVGDDEIACSEPSEPYIINVASIDAEFRQVCFWAVSQAILRGYDVTKSNQAIAKIMPTVNLAVMGMSDSTRYKNHAEFGKNLVRDVNRALDRAFEKVRCSATLQEAIVDASLRLLIENPVETVEREFSDDKVANIFGNLTTMIKTTFGDSEAKEVQQDLIETIMNNFDLSLDTPIVFGEKLESLSEGFGMFESQILYRSLYSYSVFLPDIVDSIGNEMNITHPFPDDGEALMLTLLNLLFGSRQLAEDSAWSCYRLFPQGLPEVESTILGAVSFLESFQETLEGFEKKILLAITAIEEKIGRTQQIINLIDRVLELLKGFTLELGLPAYALAHIAEGTDGLVQKLVSSGLKPSSNNDDETHALGMLAVVGGLGVGELAEFLIKMLISPEESTENTIIQEGEE